MGESRSPQARVGAGDQAFALPDYNELPLEQGVPSAWGLFGTNESLGLLNQLTSSHVQEAARTVRRGITYRLDLPLDFFDPPLFGRKKLRQEVEPNAARSALNETWHDFNPQSSSHWDALAHVGFRPGQFYNGCTLDEILVSHRDTIADMGGLGLVARAVLLDLQRTAEQDGVPYDPATAHAFTVQDLERARRAAGVEFRPGDVLLLRTGFVEWYRTASQADRDRAASRELLRACGVEHTEEMAQYLWNTHIAAAASDCPAFEVWPMDHRPEQFPFGCLHQVLLGQLGLAIGELWDLDELAAACAADGDHECMLISVPVRFPSFGSPANAIAIR